MEILNQDVEEDANSQSAMLKRMQILNQRYWKSQRFTDINDEENAANSQPVMLKSMQVRNQRCVKMMQICQ